MHTKHHEGHANCDKVKRGCWNNHVMKSINKRERNDKYCMTKYVFLSQCCMRPIQRVNGSNAGLLDRLLRGFKVPPSLTRLIQDFTEVNQAYMERERKKKHEIWFLLCISNQNFKSIDTASFTSSQKYFAQQIADLITWKKKRSKTMFKPVFFILWTRIDPC